VIIVSALTLGSLYGIQGLALGTVLAMACMAMVQFPALFKTGFRFGFYLDLKHPGVRKVYLLALPAALGVSVNQVNVFIIGRLASWLPDGSISALVYADRLIQSPISLFVLALGTAIFPLLSTRAAQGEREAFSGTLLGALRVVILSMFPASLGLMVLSQPIVSLIFQRGIFKQGSVELTAAALLFYAVGLLGQAAVLLLARGFYSLQDTRTPVKISIVTVFINLGLSLVLIRFLQHRGLALANSLANLANMALLMWFMEKKLPGLYGTRFLKFTLSVLVASGLMAVASYVVSGFLAGQIPGTVGLVVQVGLAVLAGIIIYLSAVFAFRVDEALFIWRYAGEALRRRTGA
ncbi:MAG: murein biosynthesis integral membrane protein MurJ, partial [Peptococcaceae bacterium]|nr:murein biosynthesis integral membrane protein MurJ [Peptococcaceae bacterium]